MADITLDWLIEESCVYCSLYVHVTFNQEILHELYKYYNSKDIEKKDHWAGDFGHQLPEPCTGELNEG